MPQLDARRTYSDGSILFAADLDAIIDDIETLLNSTKLNDDNIQDAGITASSKLVDASISTGKIASSAVTTAKIADDAVTAAKVADGAIDDAAKLASNVVTTAKILDANVTTAKILDANVTTAKIADSAVTTAKIADSNVTTAKIADGAITTAKLASVGHISDTNATFTTTSVTHVVTGLAVTLTNTRPVLINLAPDPGTAALNGGSGGAQIAIDRSATNIAYANIQAGARDTQSFSWVYDGTGTFVYTVVMKSVDGSSVELSNYKLTVTEF